MIGWDVFDAVLRPGDLVLLTSWRIQADAEAFENRVNLPEGARLRRVATILSAGGTLREPRMTAAQRWTGVLDRPQSMFPLNRGRLFCDLVRMDQRPTAGRPLAQGASRPYVIGWKTASGLGKFN
jgi:hypothetical protein